MVELRIPVDTPFGKGIIVCHLPRENNMDRHLVMIQEPNPRPFRDYHKPVVKNKCLKLWDYMVDRL